MCLTAADLSSCPGGIGHRASDPTRVGRGDRLLRSQRCRDISDPTRVGRGGCGQQVRAHDTLSDPTHVGRGQCVPSVERPDLVSDPTRVGRGRILICHLAKRSFRPHACGEGFLTHPPIKARSSFRPHACGEGSIVVILVAIKNFQTPRLWVNQLSNHIRNKRRSVNPYSPICSVQTRNQQQLITHW